MKCSFFVISCAGIPVENSEYNTNCCYCRTADYGSEYKNIAQTKHNFYSFTMTKEGLKKNNFRKSKKASSLKGTRLLPKYSEY